MGTAEIQCFFVFSEPCWGWVLTRLTCRLFNAVQWILNPSMIHDSLPLESNHLDISFLGIFFAN